MSVLAPVLAPRRRALLIGCLSALLLISVGAGSRVSAGLTVVTTQYDHFQTTCDSPMFILLPPHQCYDTSGNQWTSDDGITATQKTGLPVSQGLQANFAVANGQFITGAESEATALTICDNDGGTGCTNKLRWSE